LNGGQIFMRLSSPLAVLLSALDSSSNDSFVRRS
jgi:hypothetical protein